MPPVGRTAVLLTLMRELEEVMRAEDALLRDMRLERLKALQEEKAALADAYEAELRRMRDAPDTVGALEPEVRRALDEAMRSFREAVRANARRLEAARKVVEGVVKALGESVAAAQRPARYRPGSADRGAQVVSLALNHRV
jgi:hypothetical protein